MKFEKLVISRLVAMALIVLAVGCKKNEEDPGINQNMDLYIQKGKSVVIDLETSFPGFDRLAVLPDKGQVAFSVNRYLRYQSAASDPGFTFTVVTKDKTRINVMVDVRSISSDACGQPFTYAKIKKDTKLVVNLLSNPEFCSIDLDAVGGTANASPFSTDVTQNTSGLSFFTCGCGGASAAVLSYNPPTGFVGQVKSKYYFGIPQAGAMISINDYQNPTPEKWKAVSIHDFVIDVVE